MKHPKHRHIFTNEEEIRTEINKKHIPKERIYINRLLKRAFDYLNKNGIKNFENIVDLFKNTGFLACEIANLIIDFIKCQEKQNKKDLDWIKSRELNKIGFPGKNIILNLIAHQYPEDFKKFLSTYMEKYKTKVNLTFFFQEINLKIDNIQKQTITLFANNLTLKIEEDFDELSYFN